LWKILSQAYQLLSELCRNIGGLDKATICCVHSCLMKSCQYSDLYYVPAGKTRTETRKPVIVAGAYKVECCPFSDVDGELEYVWKMAKVKMFVVRRFFYFIYLLFGILLFVAVDQVVAESLCNSELELGYTWYSLGAIRSKYV
jgi:hypothetical protein